ncbi:MULTISPECIES: type I 3-dehydroquinate dehydratase [Psychrobacillus]|uniref:type I 3-dehydroquinate dehydratase n=1 Tax=Psychrobacillus TaxID=1221880 RepID=UPI0008E0538F|nr:type I 3-dehydroquinate dehydratase [Psychrobacillus psychrodurans]MCZ8541270.1 type I 3-dehydroquinate dehydratase [Psychrobacillus psychrodurans]SFM89521.1 3-dehydroquinate dehydratase [Psychrobacillus psychrodurans]
MKVVSIRDIHIGKGIPKVIVPIMGDTLEALLLEIKTIKQINLDIVEWRADLFEDIEDLATVKQTLSIIRKELHSIPLLFTFRTHREGGNKTIEDSYYKNLLVEVMKTDEIDLVDVELFSPKVTEIMEIAKKSDVVTIMSNHDFEKTPAKEEIMWRLRRMQELDAHITKIAVMPNNPADVLTLLEATYTMQSLYADRPIISMSMDSTGVISRLAGEIFGSAATFGAGVAPSAPGQIPASDLKRILELLHTQ